MLWLMRGAAGTHADLPDHLPIRIDWPTGRRECRQGACPDYRADQPGRRACGVHDPGSVVDLAVAGGADPVRADLGLVGRTPGYVVIAERREAPVAGAGEADGGRRRLAGVGVMVNGRRQYVHAECVSADWPRAGHDLCGHSVVSSAGGPWSSRAVAGASQASISRGSRAHVLTAPAGHDGGLEALVVALGHDPIGPLDELLSLAASAGHLQQLGSLALGFFGPAIVPLGRYAGVPSELLHTGNIGAGVEQLADERAAQVVGREAGHS